MTTTAARSRRWITTPRHAFPGAALGVGLLLSVPGPARADGATRANADGSDPTGSLEVSPHVVPGDRFEGPITFSVIGDAPYGDAEDAVFLQQLADHNRYSRARFVAHVGDIFAGATPCTEDRYEQTAAWLRSLDVPVFIVPGDNEWVDCSDAAQAWTYWNKHLLGLEQSFCGVPVVRRQGIRAENFVFVMSGVLFLGVNVVAGGPTVSFMESADWVEEQLLTHRGVVRAAVVFSQAGPSPSRAVFFDPFVLHAAAFGAPVLLVHGDGHSWQYESPYGVANLSRVQIERTTAPPVHITVTRSITSPFGIQREPWPAGTPENDDVPCVDAGVDRTVALGTTMLFGSARDDELASPLVLTWSQRSGPGLVTFGDAGAASTPVAFPRLGTYVLRLEAFDGFYTERDEITVVASDPATVPAAHDDSGFTQEDNLLAVPAPGVLANDSHGAGLPLTAALLVPPAHGSLTLAANGSYTYRPDLDWFGSDTFYYQASDPNGAIGVALVTLQVLAVNDPPVALAETYSGMVGQPIVVPAPGVLANDADVDGDMLTVTLAGGVANGTLFFGNDGSFTYTPRVDFIGADSFTYRVSDGQTSSFAAATLSVSPIVLSAGTTADAYVRSSTPSTNYGSASFLRVEQDRINYNSYLKFAVSGTGVSVRRARLRLYATDASPDGGAVYLVSNNYLGTSTPWLESGITWANASGMSVLPVASVGNVSNNTWVEWDVTAAVTGDGTYSFGIENGSINPVEYSSKEGSKPPQLIVETDLPNTAPVAGNDSYTTPEDNVLAVPAPGVLANDSDDPRDQLSAVLLNGPASGTLVFAANGSFTYTPAPNFHGSVGFTYRVQDGRGGASTANVTLVVVPVNDLPVAADDSYTTGEDSTLVVGAPGVLGNDADVDGQALAVVVQTPPSHGTLVLAADGSFTYAPAPNRNGPDSFTYQVSDGAGGSDTGTVSLTVTAVNDPPLAVNDSYSVREDSLLAVEAPGVLANDSDVDGDSLHVTLDNGPAHGTLFLQTDGAFIYTPAAGFAGRDSFTCHVVDGQGGSATSSVSLSVDAVNDPPVGVADAYGTNEDVPLQVATPGVLGNDGDPDGDVLTAVVATGPANGTLLLNGDGSFTYTPAPDFHGSDAFLVRVVDGAGGSDTTAVALTIAPWPDTPVAAADAYSIEADSTLVVSAPGVLGNDTDADGDALTAAVSVPPLHGSLNLAAPGGFDYTPESAFVGVDSFAYEASDGTGGSGTAWVQIDVGSGSSATATGLASTPVKDAHALEEEAEHAAAPADSLGAEPGDERLSEAVVGADSSAAAGKSGRVPGQVALLAEAVLRARPNPFNGTVVVEYRLDEAAPVEIWILDVRGQRVRRLVSAVQDSGVHQAVWNGRSEAGNPVASGVYFLRMRLGGRSFSSRLVLLE